MATDALMMVTFGVICVNFDVSSKEDPLIASGADGRENRTRLRDFESP